MLNKDERQEYYEQNKEKYRLYYLRNKEKIKAYTKACYVKVDNTTTTQKQEYYKNYYQKHKEKIKAYGKFYYNNFKERVCQNAKDLYYYKKLPNELKELIDFENVKKDRKLKYIKKNSIKTVLNEKPLIEFFEGEKKI